MRVCVLLAALVPAATSAGGAPVSPVHGVDALGRAQATFPAAVPAVDGLSVLQELRPPSTEVPSGAERADRDAPRASAAVVARVSSVGPPVPRPLRAAGNLRPHFATAPPLLA